MKLKQPRKSLPRKRVVKSGTLKTKLVRIGNSRGVRLPKAVIEQAGITGNIEIAVRGDEVVLRSASKKKKSA